MNSNKAKLTYVFSMIVILLLFIAVFWFDDGVLSKAWNEVIYIYGFVATVCAFNIYLLNRLSIAMGNIENLKESHISMVKKKVSFFKVALVRDIQIVVVIAIIVFIASLAQANTYAIIGMKLFFPLSLFFIFSYIINIVLTFKAIDGLCLDISDLVRKEKNRQKLIQELKNAKNENPLNDPDSHLRNYFSAKD